MTVANRIRELRARWRARTNLLSTPLRAEIVIQVTDDGYRLHLTKDIEDPTLVVRALLDSAQQFAARHGIRINVNANQPHAQP